VFNWAAGWVYARGLEIEFTDDYLDVAVKLHNTFGGSLFQKNKSFVFKLEKFPEVKIPDIDFVRGVFEASGKWGTKTIFIPKVKVEIREILAPFSPKEIDDGYFLTGDMANLFLHSIYDVDTESRSNFFFEKFLSYIYGQDWSRKFIEFSLEKDAIHPFKKRVSDTGWDIFLIKLIDKEEDFYFYDTGVRVKPPAGYYLDLVPRSSLSKNGFMLANSVGIIDMTYRGTIKVPLFKFDRSKPDPELPFRAVQLIPRRYYPLEMKEVENLNRTERGEGGFGSTG